MIALTCLVVSASLAVTAVTAVAPGDGDAAAPFADELPGYYEFFKRSGSMVRLDEELARDRAIEATGEWVSAELDIPAPDLKLPGSDGRLLPLRVGGPGRNTVVTTFQAWW